MLFNEISLFIGLSFSFSSVIVNSLSIWRWPSTAETCRHRRTNKLRYLDSCVLTDLPTRIYKNTTGMINLKIGKHLPEILPTWYLKIHHYQHYCNRMLLQSHVIHSFPNPHFCNHNFVNVFIVILYATHYEYLNLITLKESEFLWL